MNFQSSRPNENLHLIDLQTLKTKKLNGDFADDQIFIAGLMLMISRALAYADNDPRLHPITWILMQFKNKVEMKLEISEVDKNDKTKKRKCTLKLAKSKRKRSSVVPVNYNLDNDSIDILIEEHNQISKRKSTVTKNQGHRSPLKAKVSTVSIQTDNNDTLNEDILHENLRIKNENLQLKNELVTKNSEIEKLKADLAEKKLEHLNEANILKDELIKCKNEKIDDLNKK